MGLLDIFSKDKRTEAARSKNIARAANKHAQSIDRMKALESLANDGSDELSGGAPMPGIAGADGSFHDPFQTSNAAAWNALPALSRLGGHSMRPLEGLNEGFSRLG